MSARERTHLPAAGFDWALPLYDPVVRLLGFEATRATLIEQAAIRSGHWILDVGCGTGTLAISIKRRRPDVAVIGLDPDPKALRRSRRKAARAGVLVQFDEGFADRLPYPDASFDRVLSSFMFHHLGASDRLGMLRETARVLKPGGSFHLVDFLAPEGSSRRSLIRLVHSRQELQDNVERRVIALMREAGLRDPGKVREERLMLGLMRIAYYRAGG